MTSVVLMQYILIGFGIGAGKLRPRLVRSLVVKISTTCTIQVQLMRRMLKEKA